MREGDNMKRDISKYRILASNDPNDDWDVTEYTENKKHALKRFDEI